MPITRTRTRAAFAVITVVLATSAVTFLNAGQSPSAPSSWTQWRGPQRDGHTAVTPPASFAAAPANVWKVDVGLGHSSPLVADGRVYLHTRQGDQETVAAFDLASGKTLWTQRYPAPLKVDSAASSHGPGPKSTPTLSSGKLYTFGLGGILSCFDAATGAVKWRKSYEKEFPGTNPIYRHRDVAARRQRPADRPRRRRKQRRAACLRPRDRRDEVELERRRSRLRVARRARHRRHPAGHHADPEAHRRRRAGDRADAVEGAVHDGLRSELRHAGGLQGPADRLGREQGHVGAAGDEAGRGVAGGGGVEEPGDLDVHEFAGAGGRHALRPVAPQQGHVLRARRRDRQDAVDEPAAARAKTPRSSRPGRCCSC